MDYYYNDTLKEKATKSLSVLKLYSEYNHETDQGLNIDFFYEDKNSENLSRLRDVLKIEELESEKNELKLILRLLKWATGYFEFEGNQLSDRRYDNDDWFDVITKAKEEGFCLNCRYKSLLFTQILLAAGFRSRWVSCLPIDAICKDRHCVTEVYISSLAKWIVVDAAFNLIYFDRKGIPINLIEMRSHVINGERFRFITESSTINHYIWNCWECHVFRFQYLLENKYNMLSGKNKIFLHLNPKGLKQRDEIICHSLQDTTKILYYYDERSFYKS